jgi:Holliday junction resolvase RusA-like endonuclease
MTIEFDITPIGKPWMVRSDAWKKRDAVLRYWSFKDELTLKAKLLQFQLPDEFEVEFYIPMPPSWSKKRRAEMHGQPHQHTPDADNMLKALSDCLREDDSGIWSVSIRKFWSDRGRIVVHTK